MDIAANIGVRFRLKIEKRGAVPQPILGDLPVFPADSTGRKTGPAGFPIRLGFDPKLRAEAVLDVDPQDKPRKMKVRVEATSPLGRPYILFDNMVRPGEDADSRSRSSLWSEDGRRRLDMRFSTDGRRRAAAVRVARDPNRFDSRRTPRN